MKLNYKLLFLITLTLISCKAKNMDEKFDWTGTLSAPEEYPIEVVQGELSGEGFGQNFEHWGIIAPGWGNEGGTVSVGPDTKNLPDFLGLTWISFVEKKVYSGQFQLPKEKIQTLFKAGFADIVNPQKRNTYKTIVVGLAPKGNITLWVAGDGNQVEVAHFLAKDTHIDTTKVAEEDKYMFTKKYVEESLQNPNVILPETQEKIRTTGYPETSLYTNIYPQKYNWQPKVILPAGYTLKFLQLMMCNGEKEYTPAENNALAPANRAVPYMLSGKFTDGTHEYWFDTVITSDREYLSRMQKNGTRTPIPLDFDRNEINHCFQKQLEKNKAVNLLIQIDPKKKSISMNLEQQAKVFPVQQFQFQLQDYGNEH